VMDYLLKPIDEAQLNETLGRVCRRIDQLRSQQADTQEAESIRLMRQRERTSRLFDEILLGERRLAGRYLLSEEVCNARYQTRFFPGCYRALCVFSNLSELMGGNASISGDRIEKCMRESFPGYVGRCWTTTYKGTILLLNYAPEHRREIRQAIDAFYYSVRNLREVFGNFRLHIGVSTVHDSIQELCEAVDEAHIAEWARLTVSKDGILDYSQIADLPVCSGEMLLPAAERKEIADCVRYLRKEELGRLMEALSKRLAQQRCQSPRGVMEAFFALEREITSDLPPAQQQELSERIYYAYMNSSGYTQLVRNLYQALTDHMDELLRQASEKKGKPIAMAVRLIREHYAEQLSLEAVAEQIHVSPKYLSRLFKEEMGSGFSEYLTQIRLEAAEKLLSGSALSVREIAAQVGYLDEKYFSRLFKKETGLKPTEYKRIYG
ncbi:MAG: AraC family transcriptional regulator, partial [Aristaeellaceae bacterium]